MSDQYNTRNCIICGKVQLMCMTENVICNACEQTDQPANIIVKLRAQLAAAKTEIADMKQSRANLVKDLTGILQNE